MDRVVAARKLVAELVKGEQIEVRRAEIVGRDIAQLCETLDRPPSARELEELLADHAQVTELYASESLLEELIYRHLMPPVEVKHVEVHHPELERQIREAPDKPEPYIVYADWLQEQGDPMGELIALGVQATAGGETERARFERFLDQHRERFLTGLAPPEIARFTLSWRYGVVHQIADDNTFDRVTAEVWERVLGLRICDFVEVVSISRCDPAPAIAHARTKPLRLLKTPHDGLLPGTLRDAKLDSLYLYGSSVTIDTDVLPPALRSLSLHTSKLACAPQRLAIRELSVSATESARSAIVGLQLPHVEHLAIHLGYRSFANAIAIVDQLALPALTRLSINGGALDVDAFAKLAKLPIAPRLTSLALTDLELDDAKLRAMLPVRGELTALAELDLGGNELTRDGLEAARALAPTVISRRQTKQGAAAERRIRWFGNQRLEAAEAIADPKAWTDAGIDGDLRWARYRGTTDYELYVSTDLGRYGCTCPSSIQPCKHVVALALVAERTELPRAAAGGLLERVQRYQPVQE